MENFITFNGYVVNVNRIGYLTRGIDTKLGRREYYVAILVDGIELKKWFSNSTERDKVYESLERSIGYKKF